MQVARIRRHAWPPRSATTTIAATAAILLGLTLAVLAACVPASSVHPLYSDAELLEPIAEPAIEGEWVSFSPLRPEEADKPKVFFKITLRGIPSYFYRMPQREVYLAEWRTLGDSEKEKPLTATYDLRLVRLDGKLFFDAYFYKITGPYEMDREQVGMVPVHLIGRLWVEKDFLRIALLHSEWVEEHGSPRSVGTVDFGKHSQGILTLPTEELRDLVAQNADDPKAFSFVEYLCRPGVDCAALAYEDSLARDPANEEIFEEAIKMYRRRGNHEKALELLRRQATVKPKAAWIREDIGYALLHLRDFDSARKEFAAAEQLGLKKAALHEAMGLSYFLEGKFVEAERVYATWLAAGKPASSVPILMDYFLLRRLGRQAEAQALLADHAAKFTGDIPSFLLLAKFQGRLRDRTTGEILWPGTTSYPCASPADSDLERFFGAQELIVTGRTEDAKITLRRLLESAWKGSITGFAGQVELERLEAAARK